MHIYELFSVKDVKSGFMDPVPFFSSALAVRDFENLLRRLGSEFEYLDPRDLQLWHIGSFDLDTGVVAPLVPELVLDGSTIVFKEAEQCAAPPVHRPVD